MFQDIWEENYANKIALNKYPWDFVVTFVFTYFNRKIPKEKQKILELGFGAGCNIAFFAREGFDAYGLEASSSAYTHAKNWLSQEGLTAELKNESFTTLPYENDYFDMIVDRASLTCVSYHECQKVFHDVKRVLKKDGIFLFSPYSKAHTSYITGHTHENFLTTITQGALVGVGDLCFYDYEMIVEIANESSLEIIKCEHLEKKDMASSSVHAEWHVVLKNK
jgi:ubiquinone/menaquinone biosynthesis C-methylase UbiE